MFKKRIVLTSLGLFFGLVLSLHADTVNLQWTAVGDDGKIGTATEYDLRYQTSVITEENFSNATRYFDIGTPLPPGFSESLVVDGLEGGVQYYFALKVSDEQGNWSSLSNVISKTPCAGGCVGMRGNIDGDPLEEIDILDLVYFIDYALRTPQGPEPICFEEADIDGSLELDINDIVYLIDYMFHQGPTPPNCQQ